jgi:hypothetical protein
MISGWTPTNENATNRASGVKPYSLQASSEATITLAAPSQIPEAVPAVTQPEENSQKKITGI